MKKIAVFALNLIICLMAVLSVGCDKKGGTDDTATAVPEPTERVVSASDFADCNVGDVITFGVFEQDNEEDTGNEEISWRVLEKKDGKMLLVTEQILVAMEYYTESTSIAWADSVVRSWLNNNFVEMAFSESEKEIILSTDNSGSFDSAFVLSAEEIEQYMPEKSDRAASFTAFAATTAGATEYWWGRESGTKVTTIGVNGTGEISNNVLVDLVQGVRPAIWIDIE